MTLRVHRAERADALVRGLAELLADVPADPFTPEVVAVPTRGVERWIAQALSSTLAGALGAPEADGVCANVLFPSPARVVAEALAVGTGVDRRDDPWGEQQLAWAVLDVVDRCAAEPWCATLGRHLGLLAGQVDQGRRVAVAQKVAALFASYGAQRPAMLRAWGAGDDTDGFGREVDPDLRWQAELWRRVRVALGTPSPAERLEPACEAIRASPGSVDLPTRLSVFGPTRMTTEQLQVLGTLAEHRDVHLWLPHPSRALWETVAGCAPAVTRRRDDATADLPRHPLLRSCGRDARELQVRLGAVPATAPVGVPGLPSSLLERLQADVREDRAPGHARPDDPGADAAGDRSVQVHACHGRQRQVEVLREVLLGLLADDPTLETRDIVVMCPDIETYAPLVSAAFGGLDDDGAVHHPGHELRVRLADRSLRQTNPVLTVVSRLLDLADARLTASEVLDLAAMPPVRHRFDLDDDALELTGDWVRRSGVRWGLDAEARAPFHLAGVAQNTWQAGLDRLLVGAAMDEDGLRTVGLALPMDDVESNEVDLAGRVAELVDRLGAAVRGLQREQPLTGWVDALLSAVDDLTDVPPGEDWQVAEARRQLGDALAAAGERAATVPLRLADVRALLAHRLRGRPTRANFRTGHLTMCTMVPMRSVPHRVVCLLGLDDGVFPRQTHLDGDDVLARTPYVGERDPRAEDRQLFLDAVMAAGERLVVLYSGADERTGAERPPAVPLGELVDVLTQMAGSADGLVVRHPLQPFDPRNFVPGALGESVAFSFDAAAHAGAEAGTRPRRPVGSFLTAPLPEVADDVVELDDLVRFLEHPVRGFLRQRLGLTAVDEGEETDDAIPVEAAGLADWQVGDRLLRAGLAGVGRDEAVRSERLRGGLPPGALGDAVLAPIAHDVEQLVTRTAGLRAGPADALDVSVDLDGVRVSGTVPGVHGDRVVRVEYSRLSARHRIRAWVYLLLLVAGRPGQDWRAATVGRGSDGPAMASLVPPAETDARAALRILVAIQRTGLTRPLPLAPRTSCAYAEHRGKGSPPAGAVARAASEWRRTLGDGREIGDFDDPEHLRVWGPARLADLLGERAVAGEAHDDEPHRFGQLARQVWVPLLAHEGRF